MKTLLKTFITASCAALCAISFSACSGKSTLLGEPAQFTSPSYEESRNENFTAFKTKVEDFAASFTENTYAKFNAGENFAISPVSVYMGLSLAAECAGGTTRDEILSALGVTYTQLKENFPLLYRSLEAEHLHGKKVASKTELTNSIWVNEGTRVNASCIDALSDYYFAYSHSANFAHDNASANKAVRGFIKKHTNGLIDKDFELSEETFFALINTLYLKAVWNDDGDDLPFTGKSYAFTNADGSAQNSKLLQAYYNRGKVYEVQSFKTFFTSTFGGYKIKFIVPKQGYSLEEVFTAENIALSNSADYVTADDEKKERYFTRCLFPEYKCAFDGDVSEILKEKYGVKLFFTDPGVYEPACELSTLTEEEGYCSKIRHVTELKVNKKGIEGAAVTVIELDGAGAPGPDEYTEIYEDFIVDRAFGFVITDSNDITLFSGAVNKI